MSYLNTLNYVEDILTDNPDLSIWELGEVIYELTSDCYKQKPVDIETFIKDYYYLGNSVGDTIYPMWVDLLKKVHPHPCLNMYNEVILSTAIGVGKSTVAIISLVYEIYKLLCLKNPYEFYEITKATDKFSFSLLAPTHAQGTSVAFGKLLGMINTSPFFRDIKATPKARASVSEEGINIGDIIVVHTGSNMNHLIGKLNFGALMDEVSFFQGKDAIEKAKDLHTGFLGRKKSRFIHLGEFIPGVLWMVSSPVDEQDYLNTAIEEVANNPFGVALDDISLWEVKGDYLGDKFKVFLGDEKKEPCIIEDEANILPDILERVIDVPMEYYREFDRNITRAIRDIAGRRVRADISLFKSKKQVRSLFVNPNRFKNDVISLSFNDPNDKLENYVTSLEYFKKPLHPHCYRFIHLDIATKKDRFGFSSVYSTLEEFDINKNDINLPTLKRSERMYYIDFAVAIEAKKGEEINIFKVIDFIFLLKKLGYPIKMVTSDMFQGDVTRQFLRLHGTTTEYLSVDRTKDPYYSLRELVNTNKIIGIKNELLIKELLGLRDLKNKIDHLANSSKDLSDSVTGSLWSCLNSKEYMNLQNVYEEIINKNSSIPSGSGHLGQLMREAQKNQQKEGFKKTLGF